MAKATTAVVPANPFTALMTKGGTAPIVNSQSSSPYMVLLHPAQNTYGQMVRAIGHDKTCTPVYINGEQVKEMKPCKFIVTEKYTQCYAVHNTDGSLSEVEPAEGRVPEGKKDTVIAVILLVDSNSKLFPARIRVQGPRAKGFKDALTFVFGDDGEVRQEDWSKRSKEHTLACSKGLPLFVTAVHELAWITREPKDKTRGQKAYEVTSVTSNPCPALLVKSLLDMGKDDALVATLNECVADYHKELPVMPVADAA